MAITDFPPVPAPFGADHVTNLQRKLELARRDLDTALKMRAASEAEVARLHDELHIALSNNKTFHRDANKFAERAARAEMERDTARAERDALDRELAVAEDKLERIRAYLASRPKRANYCHIARIREILNPPPLEEESPDHA